ncbi:MAG: MarC family protein [Saprospiraceae bacterium]
MIGFFFASLGALFSVVNPLGAVPVFLAMTTDYTTTHRRSTALLTSMWFFLILMSFFLAGTIILNFFGISLNALRIAGGLIIVNSGFGLLNGSFTERRISPEIEEEGITKQDISFTPMAMPMLSGPGSISLLIGMYATNELLLERAVILGAIFAMAAVVLLILRFAPLLFRVLGQSGLAALSRIMGFLTMSIGIQYIIVGIVSLVQSQL